MPIPGELVFVIILALAFEFINGSQSSGNIVATMISSRAFSPRLALGMTALAEFSAPFIFGSLVARTFGGGIVDAQSITLRILIACLLGAISWNAVNWLLGIPSSSTHSLLGGLMGSTLAATGAHAIHFARLNLILLGLLATPVISFIAGFLVLRSVYFLARHSTPGINEFFRRSQAVTALSLAFSYGANDAQKTIGIITLGLVVSGALQEFAVPRWVILISISATAMGTLFGGWRSIRTIGGKFFKIRPVHGLTTQLTSAAVILGASLAGLPASTSQVVSSAIMGVGASERFGKVRWGVAGDILTAWVVTIPISALFGAGAYWLTARFP